MKNLLDEATAAAAAYARHQTAAEADKLAFAMDAHRTQLVYLGEVVDQLRLQNAGGQFQRQISSATCVRVDELMATARPAADSTRAAVTDAKAPLDLPRVASRASRDEVYGERYVVEVFRTKPPTADAVYQQVPGGAARKTVGRMLGLAERDGLISGAEVVKLEKVPPNAPVNTHDVLLREAESVVVGSVGAKRAELAAAEEQVRKLDQQVAAQMQELGAVVGDNAADVKAFVEAFRANHHYAQAQQRVHDARLALGADLAAHEGDLAAHHDAESGPDTGQARGELLAGYLTIAASDQPWRALQWTSAHRRDPRYADVLPRLDAIDELACLTASASTIERVRQLYTGNEKAPAQGLEQIHTYLKEVSDTYGKFKDFQALTKLPAQIAEIKLAFTAMAAGTDSADALAAALRFIELGQASGSGPVSKICNALGGMFTSVLKVDEIDDPIKAAQAAKKFYDSLREFSEIAPRLPGGKPSDIEAARKALDKIKFDFSLVKTTFGVMSLIQNSVALAGDIEKLGTHDTPAMWAKTIADGAALFSGVLAFTPLAPLGAAIGVVAGVVSIVADLIIAEEDKQIRYGEERETLQDSDLLGTSSQADETARFLVSDAGIEAANRARDLGLTAPQIRELAMKQRFLFEFGGNVQSIWTLWQYFTGSMPQPVRAPNEHVEIWQLKQGVAKTFWEFLGLYDVAKLQPVFAANKVYASPSLLALYKPAFPTHLLEQKTY